MSVENVKVMFANARRVTAPEGAEGGPADAADEPRQLPPDDLPHASKPSPRKPAVGAGGRSGKKAARADKRLVDRSCALDNRYALVYGTDVVWSLDRIIAMRVSALRLLEGNDAVKQWLVSDGRRIVLPEHVVFDPTRDAVDADYVNLFGGIAMKPQSGDVAPILALFKHVCGEDEDTIEFVLNWLALPLQCLGAKMRSAVVVHGPEGSGKNLAFEIVRDIYGEYALIVGQDQLEDKFNDYLSRKLFIIGDEVVTRHEMRHHKGRLKALISGAEIQINAKMLPLRREANFVNLVFLSNETQPLELDSGDRRYCVLWTPPPKPPAFYRAVGTCIANGGREALPLPSPARPHLL